MFGFVARTRSVKDRMQSLVRLNLELAKLEAKKKATALGVAAGLGFLAVVLIVYAIGFAFASAAAGISEALPLWLSLLIVAGALLLLAALVGFLASRFAQKASSPKPAQAIEEAERTVDALKSHV
jgi:4-amino-4-deoxy-L-arabinose transferase-like glycosyltransferase